MQFCDALELGKPRRTKEGYLAVRARAARAGVYDYLGSEVDPEGAHFKADQVVKVYRPESEVFAKDAVHSFLMKPITDNHPSVPVTADNWKQHARGVAAAALRDGDHLAFDLLLMDAAAIEAVDSGKRELSNGYACELEIGDGTAPDGTAYQATQRTIRGNHIAIVDKGRAGSTCRISDGGNKLFENCDASPVIILDAREEPKPMSTITLDGLKVDLADAEAVKAAIAKLQGQVADAVTAQTTAETQVAALTTDKATLEAKVTTLEKQLEDAKVTPAQLRDAAAAFAKVQDQGKKLGVEITDDMDEGAIMKAAVTAKLGDAAKDWTDAQIETSFATLAAQLGDGDEKPATFKAPTIVANDAEVAAAHAEMIKDMQDASKPKSVQAA